MYDITWTPEKRKISELIPHPDNPRVITKESLDELAESIGEIGMAQPININLNTNVILSGHARWLVEKENGADREIWVLIPDRELNKEEQETVLVRMNKNIAGKWDYNVLANKFELSKLRKIGFTKKELGMGKVDLSFGKVDENDGFDQEKEVKYILQVEFPNEESMLDAQENFESDGLITKIL